MFLEIPKTRSKTLDRLSCEKSALYIFILGCNFSVCTSKQLSKSIKLIHKFAPLSVKYTDTVMWIMDIMVMTVITSRCWDINTLWSQSTITQPFKIIIKNIYKPSFGKVLGLILYAYQIIEQLIIVLQGMRRPDSSDDRHVMAKHASIYPNEAEVHYHYYFFFHNKILKILKNFIHTTSMILHIYFTASSSTEYCITVWKSFEKCIWLSGRKVISTTGCPRLLLIIYTRHYLHRECYIEGEIIDIIVITVITSGCWDINT